MSQPVNVTPHAQRTRALLPIQDHGEVFVPEGCELAGSGCKLHVFLHGCGVTPTFPVFTEYAGFNEWAVKNKIIVLYPKMNTKGHLP